MATEFDLSPPEIPEPTFFDNVLRYGLFLGAIFQIVCILSILLPSSKSSEPEWDQSESKPSDITKKQKPTTPSSGKKAKKESKKKR
uniref:protein MANBAL n=1 Tax=Pristiophorus japonicus TaxID=55135 RepID=UPI00398F441D